MALYVGLDVSLRMTSICVVEADGSPVWEGKAESEPDPLLKVLSPWRDRIALRPRRLAARFTIARPALRARLSWVRRWLGMYSWHV